MPKYDFAGNDTRQVPNDPQKPSPETGAPSRVPPPAQRPPARPAVTPPRPTAPEIPSERPPANAARTSPDPLPIPTAPTPAQTAAPERAPDAATPDPIVATGTTTPPVATNPAADLTAPSAAAAAASTTTPVTAGKRLTTGRTVLLLLPFIAIAAFVGAVWGLGYLPGVKLRVDEILHPKAKTAAPAPPVKKPPTEAPAARAPREWNFFIQISSMTTQFAATKFANRYRTAGISTKVETEPLDKGRRKTFRVLVGPFPTAAAALARKDTLAGRIPRDAFVDSIRVTPGEDPDRQFLSVEAAMQPSGAAIGAPPKAPAPKAQAPKAQAPEAETRPMPAKGFSVIAGSFTVLATAQTENGRLVKHGLPAYVSKRVVDGRVWYSVVLGPFTTRPQAQQYRELLKRQGIQGSYIFENGK